MPNLKVRKVSRIKQAARRQDGTRLSIEGLPGTAGDAQPSAAHTHPESDVVNLVSDLGALAAATAAVNAAAEKLANKNAAGGYAGLTAGKLAGTQQAYGSAANTACEGNDSRLSNSRTPTTHASTHLAAGSDPVLLPMAALILTPQGSEPPAGSYATPDLRNDHPVLDFDNGSIEGAYWTRFLHNYRGGTLRCEVYFMATSGTTNNVVWGIAWERLSGLDLDADSFATEKTVTQAVAGTSGIYAKATIDFSSSEIDGVLTGEPFRLRLRRIANDAADTHGADAEVLQVVVYEV